MYKVIDTRDNTFSFYSDIRDFVDEQMSIEDVIDTLDDIYEPIDIPIIGKFHISTLFRQLSSMDDMDMLLNDEIDYRAEDIEYEVEHYGSYEWGDYTILELEEEENNYAEV